MPRITHTNTNKEYNSLEKHYNEIIGKLDQIINFNHFYTAEKDELRKKKGYSKTPDDDLNQIEKDLDEKYHSYYSQGRNINYYKLRKKELKEAQKKILESLMEKRVQERADRNSLRRKRAPFKKTGKVAALEAAQKAINREERMQREEIKKKGEVVARNAAEEAKKKIEEIRREIEAFNLTREPPEVLSRNNASKTKKVLSNLSKMSKPKRRFQVSSFVPTNNVRGGAKKSKKSSKGGALRRKSRKVRKSRKN